ncbi:MAG: hypothetical protein ABFD24_09725 [Anaerolineaceae bacterium]|jgi:hypothetical protein
MKTGQKDTLKRFLGEIPLTAELYWLVRQQNGQTHTRFNLRHLQDKLPEMVEETRALKAKAQPTGKKIFLFATLHYWIEQGAITALGLAAEGNDVTMGYLPFGDWFTDLSKFDLRRQNIYARKVLEPAQDLIKPVSFLTSRSSYVPLPTALQNAVKEVSIYDTQYTLQIEEVDESNPTYQFRLKRNTDAAQALYSWLRAMKPDVVIVPNGTILEFGIAYRVARFLKIPTHTYEFSDQKDAFWLGQNAEIMRQDTSQMWQAVQDQPLTREQFSRIKEMFEARRTARTAENFTRQWQSEPAHGAQSVKEALKLDDRPVVLLATNVLGDSLTLGRQVFTRTMADWVGRTILYFIGRPDVQLVIRIHPGEILTREYSMVDVVKKTLPELPEYIHVIEPAEKINTYDLIELADVGLVYTTTVGLEMALKGIPVVVAGQTHYRGRGFTFDPLSWVDYFKILGRILEDPASFHLEEEKIDLAWRYAYHFFYTFPLPFPWHVKFWGDYDTHRISQVMTAANRKRFEPAFRYLGGESLDWNAINSHRTHAG